MPFRPHYLRLVHWPRFLVTATFLLISSWMISGCSGQAIIAGHGEPDGFEPIWDKLVVEVAAFEDKQPAGIAVSNSGRVFLAFPWWNDRPEPSVAELQPEGTLAAFPSSY